MSKHRKSRLRRYQHRKRQRNKSNLSVSPSGGNVKYRYIGNGPDFGIAVDKESAFQYALERTGIKVVDDHAPDYQEFADMFEEWFFQLWDKVDEYEADT